MIYGAVRPPRTSTIICASSVEAFFEAARLKLRVTSSAERGVRIMIAADGKGIEVSAMPRIFEPLFTTKGSLGTGWGCG